ncbi:activating transcription factor 4b [Triplophysa dalaica]|uniref:activating transcription factor 4b n=1 Tax=Triplophysa dalaica TaxID=1582913 RepID=UPI0024DF5AD2|nr:activating transcription factor 4b [Triplophysa dalaica]
MSLMSSRFGQDDMEVLLWDPLSPMADPLRSFLDEDDEVLPLEGAESPLSSFSSSPHTSLSPPCSPLSPQRGEKAGLDLLSPSWMSSDELCLGRVGTDNSKEHSFSEMDWKMEQIDLSEFDLDSLIGSYDSEDPPSSPEELIASLESQIDLYSLPLPSENTHSPSPITPARSPPVSVNDIDSFTLNTPVTTPFIISTPCEIDSTSVVPQSSEFQELEIKSEPASPVPSTDPSESPADTLELGSEVDITEVQSPAPIEVRVPKIILSLSPSGIVLVLAPKEEVNATIPTTHQPETPPPSPCSLSSRAKPYSPPEAKPTQNQQSESPVLTGRIKSGRGSKVVVEKKLKKMEQNKTAATRYRQKKRVEHDILHTECMALEERNRELAEKADSITKEIQYLKELMEEVKKARESRSVRS